MRADRIGVCIHRESFMSSINLEFKNNSQM
jgi:hypothetical protein